ncbi:pimeloyl-ACP methyl ester carboxylesterase [Lachnotalea glycerini]|uniref:Alpha/beta hydrolase n=1 Tax=Lachnotalea glycerini TaxID=1763509 RepID=A0A255I5E5_9FIRM|nr:hypothetical protein [Lachnotalea glycerini]PXV85331.1 pimeloyl-ACP methyl ester carboxylesterase [Lachnotalea glycerini]RDY30218.1 alpha/beta hydrolase [Lachnotalea glycerini]
MKIKNKLKYTFLFSALIAFTISIINRLIYISAIIKNNLTPIKGKYYNWRFGKIFYTKQGFGNPILLIHDLDVCSSSLEWKEIIKKLSADHMVYTIDLLGCGLSDKPYLTYTNFLYVQLISDFINNVICHKTNVIASGSSSSFTIMACHNDSNLFNKIMIINPDDLYQSNFVPRKNSISLKILFDTPIIGTLVYNIIFSKNHIKNMLSHQVYIFNDKLLITVNENYEASHIQNCKGKYLFASIKGSYTNVNVIHALKEINNSIYIIGGHYKENINTIIENYMYYNSSMECFIIENTKHFPHIEAPNTFFEQIKVFFDN